jgi:ABC-type lipoprotein release transport system permease subunit
MYPEGRIQTVRIKGIDPNQKIVQLPSEVLKTDDPDLIPALIGARMAEQTRLQVGDYVTACWRDVHGTLMSPR